MRYGSNSHCVTSLAIAWIYIVSLVLGCGRPEVSDPSEEPLAVATQRSALGAPAFSPAVPITAGDALKPTDYSFDVTPTGEATWTMPIWTPAGRNGIQPSLAFTYNSRAPSSTLGLGFGLSGLSSIARCWKTPAVDGKYSEGLDQAQTTERGLPDAFCLDGQRLVPRPAAGEFQPESDPGTMVRAFLNNGSFSTTPTPSPNPDSFEVRYRNGRIARYGSRNADPVSACDATNACSLVRGWAVKVEKPTTIPTSDLPSERFGIERTLAWNIDRVEDRHHNFMEIDYDRTIDAAMPGAVEVVPKEIRWTGNDEFPVAAPAKPSRRVNFVYQSAPKLDVRTGFRFGVAVRASKLLSKVEVHANEGLVSDAVRTERLFREYRIGYTVTPAGTRQLDRLQTITECVYASAQSSQCLGPVTFIWSGLTNPEVPSFGSAIPLPGPLSEFPMDVRTGAFGARSVRPSLASDVFDMTVADLNGDGFDDIVYRLPRMVAGEFVGSEVFDSALLGRVNSGVFGDWFVRLGGPAGLGPVNRAAGVERSPGSSGSGLQPAPNGDSRFSLKALDIDLDGKAEILQYTESLETNTVPGFPLDTDTTLAPDSGDYRILRLAECTGGVCTFALKDFVGGTAGSLLPPTSRAQPRNGMDLQVGDLDGDGRADLLRAHPSDFTMTLRRNSAFGFGPTADETMKFSLNLNVSFHSFDERYVVDTDGNGQAELLTSPDFSAVNTGPLPPPRFTFAAFSLANTGYATQVQTTLHATEDIESSAMVAALVPCVFGGAFGIPARFSRYFLDLDGDGLRDSMAFSTGAFAHCGQLGSRSMGSRMFISSNTGADFRPAFKVDVQGMDGINPTEFPFARPMIDPGVRVVDLDRDGRDDLLLVSATLSSTDGTNRCAAPNPLSPSCSGISGMVWLKWNGTSFVHHVLPIPVADNTWASSPGAYPLLETQNTVLSGHGPRLTQTGDFNGDGFTDVVTFETSAGNLTDHLAMYLQDAPAPDVVVAISGGPHATAVTIDYARAGAGSPPEFFEGPPTPPAVCPSYQACPKALGVVVKSHTVEAAGFESSSPSVISIRHRYVAPRTDLFGRGFLGVDRYVRTTSVGGVDIAVDTSKFDHETRLCQPHPDDSRCRYVNSGPVHQVVDITLPGGKIHRSEKHWLPSFRTVGAQAGETANGYRYLPESEVVVADEFEGPSQSLELLRSVRTTSMFDSFGNTSTSRTEYSRGALATDGGIGLEQVPVRSVEWRASGDLNLIQNAPPWLVSLYPHYERKSTESSTDTNSPVNTRTLDVTYEPGSTEPHTIINEKDWATPEISTNSGFTLTTTLNHDSQGSLSGVVRTGSNQTRTTTIAFSGSDLDRIFPTTVRTVVHSINHTQVSYPDAVFGLPQAVDDENGIRSLFSYDSLGRMRVAQPAGQSITTVTYRDDPSNPRLVRACGQNAATGLQCSTTDPRGRETSNLADGFDLQIRKTFTYDALGHLTSETLPENGGGAALLISYTSDNLGRTLSRARPGETRLSPPVTTQFSYLGRTTTETSERGIVSTRAVDEEGRLVRTATTEPQTPREVETLIEYWHDGLPARIVHPVLPRSQRMIPQPAALVTSMQYDQLGRRELLDDPDTGTVSTHYNAFGEAKRVEDANLGVTSYLHDELGRVTRIETRATSTYPSPTGGKFAQNTQFIYDPVNGIGQLGKATSNDGIDTSLTYDSLGRLQTTAWRESGTNYQFAYAYNAAGQVRNLTYPSSGGQPFRLEYSYAGNGDVREIWNVSKVTRQLSPNGTPVGKPTVIPELLWQQLSRNGAGQSTEEQFGQSMKTQRSYDSAFQLRFVKGEFLANHQPFQRLAYDWEAGGMMHSRTDLDTASFESFTHDFMGRLSSWKVQQNCDTVTWAYGYDDWGNIRSRTQTGGPASLAPMTYDYTTPTDSTRPHAVKQITEGTTEPFSYNAAGQMMQGRGNAYTWSPFGLPSRIASPTNDSTFHYDAFRQRIAQNDQIGSVLRRTLTVGGLYELRTSTGTMTAEHVYNVFSGDGLVAQVKRAVNPSSETVNFIHRDALGSPDAITTEATNSQGQRVGQLVERGKYDPFGERRYPWAVAHPIAQRHTSSAGFTGHTPDDAFGLTNMRGRIYDPHVGRFISPDPIARPNSQALNRYSYVRNSPLTFVDPSGFGDEPFSCPGAPECLPGNFSKEVTWTLSDSAGGARWVGDEIMTIHTGDERSRSVPVATESNPSLAPSSDGTSSDESAQLARNQSLPAGWPTQVSPAAHAATVKQAFLETPRSVPVFNGTFEKLEAQRVAELKSSVDAAMLMINVMITLPTAGGNLAVEASAEVAVAAEAVGEVAAEELSVGGAGARTFEILDGVRRAKAAELAGRTTIRAEGRVGERVVETAEVPLESLRSPFKSAIDVSSSPAQMQRFKSIMQGTRAGDPLPPITVQSGTRGPSIFDIFFE